MKKVLLFTLIFFTSLMWIIVTDGDLFKPIMTVRIERCTCRCNPKYCNITSVCRPLNRTSKTMSMDIYLHPGVVLNTPVYVKVVTLKKFATVYRPLMINFKTELCKELSLKTHPLLFKVLRDQSITANLLDPCPIIGHRHTKPRISNVYDYVSPLLQIVPAGDWRVDITISVETNRSEEFVLNWSDYYEVKSLTAEEF